MGAIVGSFGSAAPTGIDAVDAIYLAVLGAALPLAGGRSRRYTWILSGLLALWVAPDTVGRLLAIAAVGLGVWCARTRRRRWAGAVVGLLLVPILGDLGAGPFLGSTTLFAAAVTAPMIASALVHLPPRRQRAIVGALTIGAAAAALSTIVFAGAFALTLDDVDDGVSVARAGFAAASDGDGDTAATSFAEAAQHFDDARAIIGGPWSLPARLVPVVGQHVRAAQIVASEGTSLAEIAADTADVVDPDQVRVVDGGVELTVIDGLAPSLDRVDRSLSRALDRIDEAQNSWLIGPIEARLSDMLVELDAAVPAARTASLAARHVPEMLGGDSPVDWLLLLTNPAEARGAGGLIGNYVVVRADRGSMTIAEAGRNEDLNRLLEANDATLVGPEEFLNQWGGFRPERFFQDVTLSPDIPTVATVAADLYRQATGTAVDGVVVVDPYVIGALLDLTGPVQVGDRRLDGSSVVDFLIEDQYTLYADDEAGRVAALEELVTVTFESITEGGLPGPRRLGEALGPVIEEDRLSVWWRDGEGPGALIDAAGIDGTFPRPAGGDLLAVVHQNAGQNKIDVFLDRELDYRIALHDGRAEATIEVTLTNRAPASGLPAAVLGNNDQGYPDGTNVAFVSVHTALDLVEARLDGEDLDVGRALVFEAEALSARIEVPPGGRRTLEIDVAGAIGTDPYRLTLPQQPLVTIDPVTVEIVDAESGAIETVVLDDHRLTSDLVVIVDR